MSHSQDDDLVMNTPTDTDYMDAQAEAIAATLSLGAKEYQAATNAGLDAMNARLDTTNNKLEATNNRIDATNVRLDATNTRLDAMDRTMQSGFKSIREELATQIAQFEVRILRSQTESFKWIVGAIVGGIAISTSITAVLVNNTSSNTLAPIVIYAQPPPIAVGPGSKTVR